ncbi:MAG: VOC family protein [Pseudolysinimonas sp.]
MTAILNPYLHFRDTARQAMEFYQSVLGGELTVQTFAEGGDAYPGEGDNVMHAQLETPSKFTLMASDTPSSMGHERGDNVFSVSISGAKGDDAELRGYWDKLVVGGKITQPLETAPWGATFGMVVDPFGVLWLINISAED